MASYLDPAFDSLGSFQPTSQFNDTTTLLSGPEFDFDSTIFSDPGPVPSRTTGPSASSSSHYTHFAEPLQTLIQPPFPYNPLNTSTGSNSFPLYDPESPFNSPASQYPVKTLTRDGRLKTRLMGVGSDGGFLTSPMIVGKSRMDSRTGRAGPPEITIDSPGPGTPQAVTMTPVSSVQGAQQTPRTMEMVPSLSMASTASSIGLPGTSSTVMSTSGQRGPPGPSRPRQASGGLGMGISGVPDLQTVLDMGDFGGGNPNLKIFGMPKNADLAAIAAGKSDGVECDFLPYPDHMPTTTLGRGKHNVREVGSGFIDDMGAGLPAPPPSATKFVEHRFRARSPDPSYAQIPPSSQQRPTRSLPARTINKAKSCSALRASARDQAGYGYNSYEPLTPASHQAANFAVPPLPGVPFNSPDDGIPVNGGDPNNMPFSFSDLYSFGLAADPVLDDVDTVKKNQYDFANELLSVSPSLDGAAGLGVGIGLGMGVVSADQDLNYLPTPFGTVSALSSPSTPYLSDPSPDVGSSAYQSHDELSSAAMIAASSIESTFSNASSMVPPLPQSNGRQRCVTYGGPPSTLALGSAAQDMVDPSLLSPQHQHRQLSSQAAYGVGQKNFSYPTRFAQEQQQLSSSHQQLEQPVQWSAENPPPLPPMPSTPSHQRAHQRSVTGPPATISGYPNVSNIFLSPENQQTAYDRNLAAFDSLYEDYEEQQALPTPTKRSRPQFDDFDEEDEDAYCPDEQSPDLEGAASGTRVKRLRTVASAPCLPARRMRPGPKPKNTKSPQEQHQSVFSATLSPPVPHIRRATSPYASPLLSDDDDGRFPDRDANGQPITAETITYTPGPAALPGQPRSSVPKEVIQSLYSGIPSHTGANGTKVPKRYVCLIEGCERTFPRKSAIESHIQTHLEDKPFVCPHDDCDASFVRQHDLRRHERIHSGNKPFPCPCGKGFARGDALARHRARGICSGSIVPRRI
ncbi:hypothetical protein JCM11641_003743 [Rhodosporidiobolus odoratus]